jgi:hypothetical protein
LDQKSKTRAEYGLLEYGLLIGRCMQMDLCYARKQEYKCYIVMRGARADFGWRVPTERSAVASAVEPGRGWSSLGTQQ